jgi:hypothetical protein
LCLLPNNTEDINKAYPIQVTLFRANLHAGDRRFAGLWMRTPITNMKILQSLTVVTALFLASCQGETVRSADDIAFIRKETGLDLGNELIKLGERTENVEFDYTTAIVYQVPTKKVVAFLEKIEQHKEAYAEKGTWTSDERHLYFRPNTDRKEKKLFITLEYTFESGILIVCIHKI